MALSKGLLSGSTNGKQIKIAATASPGDTVHTAIASTTGKDEVWLEFYNGHTATVTAVVEWGGTSADDRFELSVPPKQGGIWVVQGLPLNNALAIKVYCSVTNVLFVKGFVNRVS